VLNRGGFQRRADLREIRFPFLALVACDLHLDQLVALEVDVDLAQYRVGESLAADHHDRIEAMRARL
jgi:hypothetical protein